MIPKCIAFEQYRQSYTGPSPLLPSRKYWDKMYWGLATTDSHYVPQASISYTTSIYHDHWKLYWVDHQDSFVLGCPVAEE